MGNQIASVDRNGREINYSFDKLNRNTAEVWLDEAGNPIRTFDFEYDAASQLLNAADPDSAYSYEYDEDGRVTSIDNAGTEGVPNVVFDYAYDPVDNLTQVTDSIDGVDKGIEEFTYDELDRVTSITQSGDGVADKRVDMSYDAASQMTDMTRYSDLDGTEEIAQSNYTFDDAGRLTNLTHNSNGNVLSAYDWAYDNANRITQANSPDGVSDYNYDKTDQLVDAEHDYQDNENYVYDDNGNRVNDDYLTGENNQLLSDGTYNYEYDGEGNRVKRTEIATGEVTEYEWDYRNRLVDVKTVDSDGNVTANSDYTYDVFDRRIAKSVDPDGDGAGEAVVEKFVYDGDHIALTFDGEGNQTERFLHGNQIDQVLAQENADGEVLWALADNQGSVRMLLDNDGNVVNEISYDAFGNITIESNPDVNFRFSYTGRELDEETGLYNYRTRLYDPVTHQFVSQDTIGFAGGDSNLYRYVANSSINYIDPFGFCGVGSSGGASGNDNNDFWDNIDISGYIFGRPASASTPPPGADSNLDLNFDFPGDHSDVLIASNAYEESGSGFNPLLIPFIIPALIYQGGKALIDQLSDDSQTQEFPGNTNTKKNEPIRDFGEDNSDLPSNVFDSAAEDLPDLKGKTREEARKELGDAGYQDKGTTPGGYEKWYHPDGSRVLIRPNGEVTRTGPKVTPADGGKKYRPAIGSDGQTLKTPEDIHNTGENLTN